MLQVSIEKNWPGQTPIRFCLERRGLTQTLHQFRETTATYRKHGWQLKRVLMRAETLAQLRGTKESSAAAGDAPARFEDVLIQESPTDALWFARASHGEREAWELRLVSDVPYALFELFEADETEEEREDVRREMEARLRDYTAHD